MSSCLAPPTQAPAAETTPISATHAPPEPQIDSAASLPKPITADKTRARHKWRQTSSLSAVLRSPLLPAMTNRPPFLPWLCRSIPDIAIQLFCLLTALLLFKFAPPLLPHYFPLYPGVERSAWGMKHSVPYRAEYVSTLVSGIVSFGVPLLVVIVLGHVRRWEFAEVEDAIMALSYALSTSTLFNTLIKFLIGGLRPHFLSLCRPPLSTPPLFPGRGPAEIWYRPDEVCSSTSGLSRAQLKEVQSSFPSGHASAAFAGFGFLAVWLADRMGLFSGQRSESGRKEGGGSGATTTASDTGRGVQNGRRRGRQWKLVIVSTPLLIAVLLAASKVADGWHHVGDVVFGSVVGMGFALMGWWMCCCVRRRALAR